LFHYRKKNREPLTLKSQYNRLVTRSAWFKWSVIQNHILYNPASEIELPKLVKRLLKAMLSKGGAENVLNQPGIEAAMGWRDRATLEVLYSTEVRRMELINLLVQDVDKEQETLFVRQGKGRLDSMIPVGKRALLWVDKYLD
jgi:integrase/recombinase XerD